VIGVLACFGLRIAEACRLDRDDVDLDEGVLTVRGSKFGKTRDRAGARQHAGRAAHL
jgi:integrase/recombinase XerD